MCQGVSKVIRQQVSPSDKGHWYSIGAELGSLQPLYEEGGVPGSYKNKKSSGGVDTVHTVHGRVRALTQNGPERNKRERSDWRSPGSASARPGAGDRTHQGRTEATLPVMWEMTRQVTHTHTRSLLSLTHTHCSLSADLHRQWVACSLHGEEVSHLQPGHRCQDLWRGGSRQSEEAPVIILSRSSLSIWLIWLHTDLDQHHFVALLLWLQT